MLKKLMIILLLSSTFNTAFAVSLATAIKAYEYFDKVERLGGISCALHMGRNQCRRPSRCADGLGYINALRSGLPSAGLAMKEWMNKSGLTHQCGISLLGGNTGATFRNLEYLAEFAKEQGSGRADQLVRNPPTQDANRGSLICIESDVNGTISYRFKWGNNSFQTNTLSRGGGKKHWWQYRSPNENQAPPFTVEFDRDSSPGWQNHGYNLRTWPTSEKNCNRPGIKEVFQTRDGGRTIDVFSIRR